MDEVVSGGEDNLFARLLSSIRECERRNSTRSVHISSTHSECRSSTLEFLALRGSHGTMEAMENGYDTEPVNLQIDFEIYNPKSLYPVRALPPGNVFPKRTNLDIACLKVSLL
ncbi:unnamed protein product [Lactuca virosa]|uniref:Uncharacterized protein n=1 Tax=Lactuca virosa TaxID=75947 RepID=A0AAU9NDX9_9ASTR|nr:unnamed protein product [Lactuca virosa]